MKNEENEAEENFCEYCMFDDETQCPWYGKPRLEYVGDALDTELTTLHNINMHDNAATGNYRSCVYNDYLILKEMGENYKSFDDWYNEKSVD